MNMICTVWTEQAPHTTATRRWLVLLLFMDTLADLVHILQETLVVHLLCPTVEEPIVLIGVGTGALVRISLYAAIFPAAERGPRLHRVANLAYDFVFILSWCLNIPPRRGYRVYKILLHTHAVAIVEVKMRVTHAPSLSLSLVSLHVLILLCGLCQATMHRCHVDHLAISTQPVKLIVLVRD